MDGNQIDELVPRRRATQEFGVCQRTIARWERIKLLGFDEPVVINNRVYHRRSRLELGKAALTRKTGE